MNDCVFCQIVNRLIPAEIIFEDDLVMAFNDIRPITPAHILIIPKKHIDSLNQMDEDDAGLLGHMVLVARNLGQQNQIVKNGYRLVINTGPDAGQSILHLHLHLLGGRKMPFHFN